MIDENIAAQNPSWSGPPTESLAQKQKDKIQRQMKELEMKEQEFIKAQFGSAEKYPTEAQNLSWSAPAQQAEIQRIIDDDSLTADARRAITLIEFGRYAPSKEKEQIFRAAVLALKSAIAKLNSPKKEAL